MKKVLIFLGLLLLCLFVGGVSAMSGNGTASDPYILTTSSDLTALSGTGIAGYNVSGYYELGADIDMSDVENFGHIGTSSLYFRGHFDGKNHTISNMTCSATGNNCGFIQVISVGTVSNIIFKNCKYTGEYYTAFFCRQLRSNSSIINCVFDSCYIMGYCLSGLAWDITGTGIVIQDCIFKNCIVTVIGGIDGSASAFLGSISNDATNASIDSCKVINTYIYSYGGNPSYSGVGGFVSRTVGGICAISNCEVSKSTLVNTLSGGYVGGIYARPSSGITITDCTVSDCSLIGTSYVSGVGN